MNCFGPFKRSLSDLQICDSDSFTSLHFEKKCPTELRGMPPNLDVMIERPDHVVAIESKCTEYLRPHTARFSASYETKSSTRVVRKLLVSGDAAAEEGA